MLVLVIFISYVLSDCSPSSLSIYLSLCLISVPMSTLCCVPRFMSSLPCFCVLYVSPVTVLSLHFGSCVSCFIMIVPCPVFSVVSFASSPSRYVRLVPVLCFLSVSHSLITPCVFLCPLSRHTLSVLFLSFMLLVSVFVFSSAPTFSVSLFSSFWSPEFLVS